MYFANLSAAPTLPTKDLKVSCSTQGICNPQDAPTLVKFKLLQSLINDVRVRVGLPPSLAVDGSIGPSTVASLIKLAEKLMPSATNPYGPPPVLEKFAIQHDGKIPDALSLVKEIEAVTVALKMYLPAAPSAQPPVTKSPKKGVPTDLLKRLRAAVSPSALPTTQPTTTSLEPYTPTEIVPAQTYDYSASGATSKFPKIIAAIGFVAALGGIAFMIHHSRKNKLDA